VEDREADIARSYARCGGLLAGRDVVVSWKEQGITWGIHTFGVLQ
jgi:hypothetical protein